MNDPFGGYQPQASLRPHLMMRVGDLSCQLNMPVATRSQFVGGVEQTSRLAPSAPTEVFRVDDYPGCPAGWARSNHTLASYFFAAKPGHMVWFDLRVCEQNPHHVAALVSAQGINAVTGVQMTPPPRLEWFDNGCPIHGRAWNAHHWTYGKRVCDDCGGREWPAQNYIATTSVSPGRFWRDGFCARDGQTREFLFTEDTQRGVAAQVIGEERVNAFGIALFKSIRVKPRPTYGGYRGGDDTLGGGFESIGGSKGVTRGIGGGGYRSMEVGAGAVVNQTVEQDSSGPGFWHAFPDAVFVLYYVSAEEFADIVGRGSTPRPEGFIPGPVGNS